MDNNGVFHRRWWWLIIAMTAFSLAGWLIIAVLPVRYTQTTDLQLTFLYSDDINWDDTARNSFTRALGVLIESPQVITTAITNAAGHGLTLTEAQVRAAIHKEQRFYGWQLVVYADKAENAQVLLDSWQAAITAVLAEEQSLLLAARTAEQQANQWFACLQQLPVEPTDPLCSQENADTIAASYQQTYDVYAAYREQIQFLQPFSPDFSYQWRQVRSEPMPSPLLPVGITLLIAALVGGVIAYLLIHKSFPGEPSLLQSNNTYET